MKNFQFFPIFIFFFNLTTVLSSKELDGFLKSVDEAQSQLEWLDQRRSRRQSSIEDLLSRFVLDDDEAELYDSDLISGDAWYQSFRARECEHGGCPKKPIRWKVRKTQPDDYYDYYDDYDDSPKTSELNDQREDSPNDLSHEANYKLSKYEQDAAEKTLPNSAWPFRSNSKRTINPMEEVKLKTSLRMLKNGDGPFLPSSILEDGKPKITVEDVLNESKFRESPHPWKENYDVFERRKLLSIVDEGDEVKLSDGKGCRSKHCLNDKQKNKNLGNEIKGLHFDNLDAENDHHDDKQITKDTSSRSNDDQTHGTTFKTFQNYLKRKLGMTSNKTKTTTKAPGTGTPLNLVDNDREVNINLHMSVNATLLGENHLPGQFHKNNSITFKPPTVKKDKHKKDSFVSEDDSDLLRETRGIIFPTLMSDSRRRTDEEKSESLIEDPEDLRLDELISGKLTSKLVKTIFAMVKSSPSLKVLWPGLMRNKIATVKEAKNFYAVRTQENEPEMQGIETMLRQAMESINSIIEQQVRSRSCVPLRPDLRAFYNLIVATKAENDQLQGRQKRQTQSDDIPSLSDTQIRKKSRIVKKLLKDYEELPSIDQDQVANIKERLLLASEELKNLEQISKRKKRQIIGNLLLQNDTAESKAEEQSQLTPQYIKLARMAEMLAHNSFKDSDLSMNFNFV